MTDEIFFPSSKDSSKESPIVLLGKHDLLRLYNQSHSDSMEASVNPVVQDWVRKVAQHEGWKQITFTGQQCILSIEELDDQNAETPVVQETAPTTVPGTRSSAGASSVDDLREVWTAQNRRWQRMLCD